MSHEQISVKHYLESVRTSLPVLVLVSILAALSAYGVSSRIKPEHHVHYSYLVSLAEREDASEYRFDGYYALQSTDAFATTLASWAKAPEVIFAALQEASIDAVPEDARQIQKFVRADKTAPQLVQITVTRDTAEEARLLADALKIVINQNIERYHIEGTPEIAFNVVSGNSWQSATRISVFTVVLATFVFVFFIGVNIVLIFESVKQIKET